MDVARPGVDAAGFNAQGLAQEAAGDPRAIARHLRRDAVAIVADTLSLVTRRADVERALRDPGVFSSGVNAVDLGNIRPLIPLQVDPPHHIRYRRMLDPLFAPQRMAALEIEITALADLLIDRFVDGGACDLHEQFAVPLPCTVFLDLLGLPASDLPVLLAMKDGIIRPAAGTAAGQTAIRQRTARDIYAYFADAIADHRDHPRDDVLQRILVAESDGVRLTDDELLDICFLLVIAGLDTVTDAIDCMFAYLARHADHRGQLVADEALVPTAVEELLRWESPVPAVARVSTEDTDVGGCSVRSGQRIMLLIGSANTDDAAQPAAGIVDLGRKPNRHLAFGGGIHRCLGSHLARVELRAAVRQFHRRIPEYRLAPGAKLRYTTGLRCLETLPLVFECPPGTGGS